MLPIKSGSPTQFATLKAFLDEIGYTTGAISERTGHPSIYHFQQRRDGRTAGLDLNDALDMMIRIFMDVEIVEWSTVRRLLPAPVVESLVALGLIIDARTSTDRCQPSVLLYPAGSQTESGMGFPELYACSDLNADPDPDYTPPLASDVVYPAVTINSGIFHSFLPRTPCEAFLELCSGAGVAALLASRLGARAWAVDITDRSTAFADFNARLNGITNFEAVKGDLYEPVRGLTFDRIVAHPPYVASSELALIFRDGGMDGERIFERIVTGLPAYLRPGGRFYCTCRASDRVEAPLEQRVRAMLGPDEAEFDVLIVSMSEDNPLEHYGRISELGRLTKEEVQRQLTLFRELKVEQFVYSTIVVQRRAEPRPTFTERRRVGKVVCSSAVEWLMELETSLRRPGADARLLDARPVVADGIELEESTRRTGGDWSAMGCSTSTDWPFSLAVRSPAWAAALIRRCDGKETVRDHVAWLAQHASLGPTPEETVLTGIRALSSAGILNLELHPLPDVPAGRSRIRLA